MEVNQIYELVNDASKQAFGEKAPAVLDVSGLVSLGDYVFSSTDNVDLFYKALTDRIGKTYFAIRKYEPRKTTIFRDYIEFGSILQKISYKLPESTSNNTWIDTPQASPFDIETNIQIVQNLFSIMGTWTIEEKILDRQLKKSFTSTYAMAGFIAGIYTAIENSFAVKEESMERLARNTFIAGIFNGENNNRKRNVLAEYNALIPTANLTVSEALMDVNFLKYASKEINLVTKNMRNIGVAYNDGSVQRFTDRDKMVVEVLSQFAAATSSYLESDTFHKELVSLPKFEEVSYWQGSGTKYAFEDTSAINIKYALTGSPEPVTINKTGIIAVVRDIDGVVASQWDRRSSSVYNFRSEVTNYMEKCDAGFCDDLSENGVVFYMAED